MSAPLSKEDLKLYPDVQVAETSVSNAEGFQNVLNFRDVGTTVNQFLGEK